MSKRLKSYVFNPLRGLITGILLLLNTIITSAFCIVAAALLWLISIPLPRLRQHSIRWLVFFPTLWIMINHWIIWMGTHNKWDIQGDAELLDKDSWYIMISNHCSWIDIPILGSVFYDKIPLLKFFMKKELLWTLPLAGLVCYMLGYPLMERHTPAQIKKQPALKGTDIATSKKACEKFKICPTTVVNFIESTRFTKERYEKQAPPYQYLMKPKAGGSLALVMNEMTAQLKGIINVTIYYDMESPSLWKFICGEVRRIHIHYELIPITEELLGDYEHDRAYRVRLQHWLNEIWHQKDQKLQSLHSTCHKEF